MPQEFTNQKNRVKKEEEANIAEVTRELALLLDEQVGKSGTVARQEIYEHAFRQYLGLKLRSARKMAGLTQLELARKIGRKETYLSRIENGHVDLQLSSLVRIVEIGLAKKLQISFVEQE